MKLRFALTAAAALVAGFGFVGTPAHASSTCPEIGSVDDCNKVITINSDGSVTITTPNSTGFGSDHGEEMIGVVNNSGKELTQFDIDGTGLFAFDGNGLQSILGSSAGGSPDTTTYGGKTQDGSNTYFINYTANTGTVVLGVGVDPGDTAYFSLDGTPSTSFTVDDVALPEPAGIAILGTGIVGLFVMNRRRSTGASALEGAPA